MSGMLISSLLARLDERSGEPPDAALGFPHALFDSPDSTPRPEDVRDFGIDQTERYLRLPSANPKVL